MVTLIYFLFGLIVGSFLNAVIFRLHKGESFVGGRSKCPHCRHVLGPLDLVPLFSFIFLRGRCRYCSGKISAQYPAVEFGTGLAFAFLAQSVAYNIDINLIRDLIFVAILIVIAVYDWKHYLILDKVVFPSLIFGLVVAILLDIQLGNSFTSLNSHTLGGVVSGLIIAGFFLLQFLISKGAWIGFGDVKLGLLLGVILGWPYALLGLFVAYVMGALFGIILIALNKKQLSSRLPFGTFLAFSAIIIMIWGNPLHSWYLDLLGF